jgi:hypothetical protein
VHSAQWEYDVLFLARDLHAVTNSLDLLLQVGLVDGLHRSFDPWSELRRPSLVQFSSVGQGQCDALTVGRLDKSDNAYDLVLSLLESPPLTSPFPPRTLASHPLIL